MTHIQDGRSVIEDSAPNQWEQFKQVAPQVSVTPNPDAIYYVSSRSTKPKGIHGAGEGNYLLTKHDEFAADGDVQTDFYEPLFFKTPAEEGFQSREFDRVPYLNGGLFSETVLSLLAPLRQQGRNPYEELHRIVSSNEMISSAHAVPVVDTPG